MATGLNRLIESVALALRPRPRLRSDQNPIIESGSKDDGQAGQAQAEQPAQASPNRQPVELQIESTRCDLHPLYVLREAKIEIVVPGTTLLAQVEAACCPKPGCTRHYLPEHGYFAFVPGEISTIEGAGGQRRCCVHQQRYMAVAKTHGDFMWACLQAGCCQAEPY